MKKTLIEDMGRLSVEEFKQTKKIPLLIVLDNVRSQHNIGAIFRTSDAFLIEKIYLCGITATPPNRDIQKSALGATESVDWEYREKTYELINELKTKDYVIWALEQAEDSVSLNDIVLPEKGIVLILGNEVNGVDDNVMELADLAIEIPQYGTKHSLNVSVSGGIAIWDIAKKYLIKS